MTEQWELHALNNVNVVNKLYLNGWVRSVEAFRAPVEQAEATKIPPKKCSRSFLIILITLSTFSRDLKIKFSVI